MIRPHTEEEIEEGQRRLRATLRGEDPDAPPPPPPPLPREPVIFRGRLYVREPVAMHETSKVQSLIAYLERLGREDLATLRDAGARDVMRRSAPLLRRYLRPATGWRRWLWWLPPNPFRNAGPVEIGILLGILYRGTFANTVESPLLEGDDR